MEKILLCLLCLSDWSVSSRPPREYHYVSESMTWTEAQTYCREKYTDLATIKSNEEMNKVKSLVPWDEPSSFVWIGLYMKIQWKWSDGYRGSDPGYTNWENIRDNEPDSSGGSQFRAQTDDKGMWWDEVCESAWTSICYAERSKRVIKLKMKLDDPSVDLNNPAVKAGLLKALQEQLRERGVNEVTLKWREQPDGKVFHKEGESSEKESPVDKDEGKCEL